MLQAQWYEFVHHLNIFSRGRRCFRFREMFGRASSDLNKAQEASTSHARCCLLQWKDMDFLHAGGDLQSNTSGEHAKMFLVVAPLECRTRSGV